MYDLLLISANLNSRAIVRKDVNKVTKKKSTVPFAHGEWETFLLRSMWYYSEKWYELNW